MRVAGIQVSAISLVLGVREWGHRNEFGDIGAA